MIYDFAFTWAVVALIVLGAVACGCAVRWLVGMLERQRTESRIRAAEKLSAADLATCQRIASLDVRDPRRTP